MKTYEGLTQEEVEGLKAKGIINGAGCGFWRKLIPELGAQRVWEEHDFNYWVGGTAHDRYLYDQTMRSKAYYFVRYSRYGVFKRFYSQKVVSFYYILVRIFGRFRFNFGNRKTYGELLECLR